MHRGRRTMAGVGEGSFAVRKSKSPATPIHLFPHQLCTFCTASQPYIFFSFFYIACLSHENCRIFHEVTVLISENDYSNKETC